jgi:hypothetical protein
MDEAEESKGFRMVFFDGVVVPMPESAELGQ